MEPKIYTVVVADDEPGVREVLNDLFTRDGYRVFQAQNGIEALAQIKAHQPDLVVSDIQMPELDGFNLFLRMDTEYPQIKRVLITGYDIDEYISIIRKFNIGNILVKGAAFNLQEVSAYIRGLLTGDIFGLQRYFKNDMVSSIKVCNHDQARAACNQILSAYNKKDAVLLEIAIDELISNAVFHGVLQLTDTPREQWNEDYLIDPASAITVEWALDPEKIGVAVVDPKGNLKKTDVLRWLDSPIDEDTTQNVHGKGLLLIRRLLDRFIINITPNQKTECIILKYLSASQADHNKPLLIHELGRAS
ncbi:MAG: response regulator [Chitinivibrionales bacterium]|nr:response regulator [Chitinivibrionales bacterium]